MLSFFRSLLQGLDRQLEVLQIMISAGFERQETRMAEIDDRIAKLQADVSAMGDQVASATTVLSHVQQEIADGIQAGLAAGATPDQLAALSALDAALSSQTQALAQAIITSQPQPANPPPPAGGNPTPPPPPPSP
jgi:septal ring factor EnvC (AmiA/AmiB activator)